MNKRSIFFALVCVSIYLLICSAPATAIELVSEARSVIQGIQTKSSALSGELAEFHKEFSARAAKMVELEATVEDLKKKGYIGKSYNDTPEKYERVYAEYARYVSEIKDVFVKHFPRIQNSVSVFNKSIYYGKDRIAELRSDDLAIVNTELARSKQSFQKLQQNRVDLETMCSEGKKHSRNCKRQWRDYQRQLRRLKQSLARLEYIKKISDLKDSIVNKISRIMEKYVYKEADTVDMLMDYAFNFEQYADFIGNKDLGDMLKSIRELSKLEDRMRDFEQFQKGLGLHVADMGNQVVERLDHFIKKAGMEDMDMESRSEVLRSYEDQEDEIAQRIRKLEQEK